jgi:hypothetical protein
MYFKHCMDLLKQKGKGPPAVKIKKICCQDLFLKNNLRSQYCIINP